MVEGPPNTQEQVPNLTPEQERILALEGVKGIEPAVKASHPENVRTPAEYRRELAELENLYEGDSEVLRFLYWLKLAIDYLEYPFRYVDSFGPDGESHVRRKEWEHKTLTKDKGTADLLDTWNKTQISKNFSMNSITTIFHFAPPELKRLFSDLESEIQEITEQFTDELGEEPPEGSKTRYGTDDHLRSIVGEAPYLALSLEEKKEVVQKIVNVVHKLIDRSLAFYREK